MHSHYTVGHVGIGKLAVLRTMNEFGCWLNDVRRGSFEVRPCCRTGTVCTLLGCSRVGSLALLVADAQEEAADAADSDEKQNRDNDEKDPCHTRLFRDLCDDRFLLNNLFSDS